MLMLRPAIMDDAHFVWECRNDPDARRESLHPEPIPFSHHAVWFRQALTNPLRRIWIAETADQTAVGYGRLDWETEGADATISVAVAPALRRLGFGVQIIQLTTSMSRASVWATIRTTNIGSLRAFAAAGYQPIVTGDVQQWKFSR